MKRLKAFILGMVEFRKAFSTKLDDADLMRAYDRGRNLAHRLTFRDYEDFA